MSTNNQTQYLKDYKPSNFIINSVDLDFSLFENQTIVSSKLLVERVSSDDVSLDLVGEGLELLSLCVNGKPHTSFQEIEGGLVINDIPSKFTLSLQVKINPEKNTLLEGLYKSSSIFCTQCEAEGFRRITYFLFCLDVMTVYKVRIEANKEKYPVLLSNGNLIESGNCGNGRHYAKWYDPFRKPSYLFALVAGDLAVIEKRVNTKSGREVLLQIYTEHNFINQADYALQSLERALKWDEDKFNLEYDLDRYMVVAIGDFNMGAMENKGLNIFNSKYVLATTDTATDTDFFNIENIIGHEYFHNWTGNRVTCRDWFQLSLKEGLTVFRDALFSADMTTKGIKRLEEVKTVREHQFVEDNGPMSHPVRPDNYIEINNFYTLTVYEKGSEVIRMMYNLMGEAKFKKGIEIYFDRFDGCAVTVEDFVKAMADASGIDLLGQFFNWYTQSGTPELNVTTNYDSQSKTYKIELEQNNYPTAGQEIKQNILIPISYKLYTEQGESISSENTIVLTEKTKLIEFGSITKKPVLSLLRNFSAPVILNYNQQDSELHTLIKYDDDLFVRYDSLQNLLKRYVDLKLDGKAADVIEISKTLSFVLNSNTEKAEKAELISLPEASIFFIGKSDIDAIKICDIVNEMKSQISINIKETLLESYNSENIYKDTDLSFKARSERSLNNACLELLSLTGDNSIIKILAAAYNNAKVMTNKMGALKALNNFDCKEREESLSNFLKEFKDDPQVVDKWLALNASSNFESTYDKVNEIANSELFTYTTPNKVRALFGVFCMQNTEQFHHSSGRGYELLGDLLIKLDKINPGIAARMVTPLTQWKQYNNEIKAKMKSQLDKLSAQDLSKDLYEKVSKSLV